MLDFYRVLLATTKEIRKIALVITMKFLCGKRGFRLMSGETFDLDKQQLMQREFDQMENKLPGQFILCARR